MYSWHVQLQLHVHEHVTHEGTEGGSDPQVWSWRGSHLWFSWFFSQTHQTSNSSFTVLGFGHKDLSLWVLSLCPLISEVMSRWKWIWAETWTQLWSRCCWCWRSWTQHAAIHHQPHVRLCVLSRWSRAGCGDVLWIFFRRWWSSEKKTLKRLQRLTVCSGVLQVSEGRTPKYVNKTFFF